MGRHGAGSGGGWGLAVMLIVCMACAMEPVRADGNIGCLFFDDLCTTEEWCYDDYVFGKCLGQQNYEESDLERHPLAEQHAHILLTMLQELRGAGLGWDNAFVQCRMQTALRALQDQQQLNRLPSGAGGFSMVGGIDECADLVERLPAPALEQHAAGRMAFVRFVPPASEDGYADELYSPPQALPLQQQQQQQHQQEQLMSLPLMQKRQHHQQRPVQGERNLPVVSADLVQDMRNRIALRRMLAEYEAGELPAPIYRNYGQQLNGLRDDVDDDNNNNDILASQPQLYDLPPSLNLGAYGVKRAQMQAVFDDERRTVPDPFEEQQTAFREVAREYHMPKVVLDSAAVARAAERSNELPLAGMVLSVTGDEQPEMETLEQMQPVSQRHHGNRYANSVLEHLEMADRQEHNAAAAAVAAAAAAASAGTERRPAPGVYTEGGLVYVPETVGAQRRTQQYAKQMEAASLLNSMLGFTRHERLDVKKPGPLVQPADAQQPPPASSTEKAADAAAVDAEGRDAEDRPSGTGFKDLFTPKMKKILHQLNDHGPHSVDTEYTYVIMRAPIESWSDGPRLVAAIAETLNMKNYLTFSRVDRHEISFRVEENPQRRTAADIARAINESRTKNNLLRRFGYSVVVAGVGDKTKVPLAVSVIRAEPNQPDVTYILTYILLGAGSAALMVVILAVVFVRRSERKRNKLGGLQAGLTNMETNSKDYQDLCRTRMAGKGGATAATTTTTGGAIGAEGRSFGGIKETNEKQQTSSRSSVSSWSEEPATNLDISTGHMVLSYMEDHLKNKGRLQREWEALCRYEAEPSSRDAASKPECSALNRSTAPLPYDHSRVMINHLANTDGLDYINASSITDHDPRSAAYIAAQGPLPSTLAHFWQMVWEQGSIMIVMLCRLQEQGTISCARYWPEEGSECYDIYEVHLVSEHTTCDDYLVRSFYLKNLRTGETRTVTQFHFLAWPAFGLPAAAKTLLEFRRKVNKSFRGRASPVIVHSSNGAGRTGSYILLDMVLGRMHKGAREIDIAATLEHLRDQRAGLVATQQQFEFVLMAVAEEVHAILKALPANTQPEKRELDSDAVRESDTNDSKKLIDVSETPEAADPSDGKTKKKE